jgi:hypothetical protein
LAALAQPQPSTANVTETPAAPAKTAALAPPAAAPAAPAPSKAELDKANEKLSGLLGKPK